MTDREKLIEVLESTESAIYWNSEDKGFIQKIADHLIANGVTFAKDTNVPSWIPVSERLPTPYVNVITCRRDFLARETTIGNEYITIRDNEIPSWSQDYRTWKSKVTHWMPLPEPPKEDDHE